MNLVQKVARGRVTGGLVAMLACLSWPAPLRAEPIRYLAEAHVTASEYKVLCFGCPTNTQTELISASNGGPGSTSASHGYDAPGKVAVSARASFDPTQNDLPVLKARATAEIFFDPPPPSPLTVVYEYTAGATARGMNLFTYHGTSPETYELTFWLEAVFFDNESAYGGLVVWDGLYDPRAEIHPQLAGWFELLTGPDRATLTHTVSKTLSFTVEPFDVFTVDASLIVSASSKTDDEVGYVDAFNTFRAAFTAGDTSLLTAASASGAAPVPEPASAALVLSGLLWAASRRHINTRPITEPATPEACGSRPSRNG